MPGPPVSATIGSGVVVVDRRQLVTVRHKLAALPLFLAAVILPDQQPEPHSKPPKIQFVEVEPGVRLEVLDWGGNGRPVVLLAGLGDTAHVYDQLARKLTTPTTSMGSRGGDSVPRACQSPALRQSGWQMMSSMCLMPQA